VKVFVDRFPPQRPLRETIELALDWLGWSAAVSRGARVFLKPNLTWREPMDGVTTTPAFVEAVALALRERGHPVTLGESHGGYHTFDIEEAFRSHGLRDLEARAGVRVVNLSEGERERVTVPVAGQSVTVELPKLLLHDVDVFVTLPVPKVHAMTHVSLGFKNQWGCQPDTMRLRNHPRFAHMVLAINRALRTRFALFDGRYFLDRTGPMIGLPVSMNLLVAADDVGAGTLACCEIMGIPPRRAAHLRLAIAEGMMPRSLAEVALSQPLAPFQSRVFRLERRPMHFLTLTAFHSRLLTTLFYDSALSSPLRAILYRVRRHRLVGRLLYGEFGPPAVEGRRRAK
jgi:uncharacterized protein (DUF362 family)